MTAPMPCEDDLLPCGESATAVWDDAVDPDHVAGCEFCTSVVEARALVGPRAAELPPVEPPRALLEGVMRTVVAELRPAVRIPLPGVAGAAVTTTALAAGLRLVLDDDPGVLVRRLRVEPADADGQVHVGLVVAVSWEHATAGADAALRARVADTARRLFGLVVAGVDIAVVDLIDLPAGEPS
jgi:hypothetical protein